VGSRIIGLDIGTTSLRVVVLDAGFRSLTVVEMCETEILVSGAVAAPEGEESDAVALSPAEARVAAVAEALERLRAQGMLEAEGFGVAATSEGIYLTPVALPFSGAKEIGAVLVPQLDGRIPEEVESLQLAFTVGNRLPSGEHQVFVAAAKPEAVAERLETLAAWGIDPRVLELSPFPVAAAAAWLLGPTPEPVAVLDIGAQRASLVVIADQKVEFVHTVAGGGALVTAAIMRAFPDLDEETARMGKHRDGSLLMPAEGEAWTEDEELVFSACDEGVKPLVRDLRRSLHAHATQWGRPVTRLYLTGGGSQLRGLAEHLGSALGVETELLPATRPEVVAMPDLAEQLPIFTTALGLALRAAGMQSTTGLDLRVGASAFKGTTEHLRGRLVEMAAWGGAIVAALMMMLVARASLLQAEVDVLDTELSKLTTEVMGKPVTGSESILKAIKESGDEASFIPKQSAFDIFAAVTAAVQATSDEGYDAKAKQVEVDLQRKQFLIKGIADTAESVDALETKLSEIGCIKEIKRGSVEASRTSAGFDFDMKGTASCAAIASPAKKAAKSGGKP
jgi:type IV pilus assembly protein PilM